MNETTIIKIKSRSIIMLDMTARISHTRSVILHINGPNQLTLHLLRRACTEIVVLIEKVGT